MRNVLLPVVAAALALVTPALAFDAGGFAMQQHQNDLLRQQTAPNNNDRNDRPSAGKRQRQMQAEVKALQARHRREMLAEYNRRVAKQGKPAADRWAKAEAERRGRQTALYIKQKYGLN